MIGTTEREPENEKCITAHRNEQKEGRKRREKMSQTAFIIKIQLNSSFHIIIVLFSFVRQVSGSG